MSNAVFSTGDVTGQPLLLFISHPLFECCSNGKGGGPVIPIRPPFFVPTCVARDYFRAAAMADCRSFSTSAPPSAAYLSKAGLTISRMRSSSVGLSSLICIPFSFR